MPSQALIRWNSSRSKDLDEIDSALEAIGGTGRGRPFATQQLNRAYAVILAAQFQAFCRDLHTECAQQVVHWHVTFKARAIILGQLTRDDRQLKRANAQPGSIGSDFGRLGVQFWDEVEVLDLKNLKCQKLLMELNDWRNAIAHHDFDDLTRLGGTSTLHIEKVREWRIACDTLAKSFDEVMRRYLTNLNGSSPW